MNKFNQYPPNWHEISNEEFAKIFFHYQTPTSEFRQMFSQNEKGINDMMRGYTTAKLYPISNFDNDEIGIALFQIYINSGLQRVGFAKFGTDENWMKFEGKFVAQFRGDNS